MAHGKNHYVTKQDETWAEVDVEGKDLKIIVPDNRYAYGDSESIAQIAEEVVGKHSNNSDTAAKKAYEQAKAQLETTDFAALKRKEAIKRVNEKKPKFIAIPDERGCKVITILTHPSGFQELKEKHFTHEQLAEITGE